MATDLKASEHEGGLRVDILVQPRAGRERLGPIQGERLRVAVTAPPADGEANAALLRLLSERLGVPRTAVRIVSGHRGRRKTLHIEGITLERLLAACDP